MTELIIHGHFYQPPREDPWIEEIEGEPSAAPNANWNERIHLQCYRPNAHSRILGEYGRVREILNNYVYLSFNFGPTLLSWMKDFDPETLDRIVAADRESIPRNDGHGNAIAQAYNHIIMPLADHHDRETQIRWGLADFRLRFGREPESMWMPETAVDIDTLELLVAHGMQYVILSPFQASEVQDAHGQWRKTLDGRFDTGRAYWVKTHSSRIAVFFYHGALSSDISFNHLLRSSDVLADRIAAVPGPMVNLATDGEIYGHHEPYGDMGLAHACRVHFPGHSGRLKTPIRVTNYGSYLERHPPTLEAKLRPGGSSWSCAHGVERWRSDCGCKINHTGGWTQAWRAPLREGLDHLRDALRKTYEEHGEKVFKDPWEARNEYIDVVLGEYDPKRRAEFAHRWFRRGHDKTVPWRLLESQRNAMLMFTSCGWFFDDISGIEPRQLMLYAARAIDALGDLAPHGVEEHFRRRLRDAKSNDPAHGDGEQIYKAIAHPKATAKLRILNQAILSNYGGIKPHRRSRYATNFSGESFWETGDEPIRMGRGTARVRDIRTEVEKRYAWVARFNPRPEALIFDIGEKFRWPGGDPRGKRWEAVRPVAAARKGTVVLSVRDLFKSEARQMVSEEISVAEKRLDRPLHEAVATLAPVLEFSSLVNISPDPQFKILFSLMADFLWASYVRSGRRDEARHFKHRVERFDLVISKQSISAVLSEEADRLAKPLKAKREVDADFDALLEMLRAAQEDEVLIEAKAAQEAVYEILKSEGRRMIAEINNELYPRLLTLFEAAERLYIDIGDERAMIAGFEERFAEDPKYWP